MRATAAARRRGLNSNLAAMKSFRRTLSLEIELRHDRGKTGKYVADPQRLLRAVEIACSSHANVKLSERQCELLHDRVKDYTKQYCQQEAAALRDYEEVLVAISKLFKKMVNHEPQKISS